MISDICQFNSKDIEMSEELAELTRFFKALADANRLRIVGLLAGGECSVEQLADMVGLRPSTVSHHLARLAAAGLVSARAEGYYNLYRLETEALEAMSARLLSKETLPAMAGDVDVDAYDRKVLAVFCDSEGRILRFPAQRKKFEVLLRHVGRVFQPGVRYPEKKVNEMLADFSDDTATLRRGLVETGMLAREGGGGDYWLREG
jgi:predicted transcriptional regulator